MRKNVDVKRYIIAAVTIVETWLIGLIQITTVRYTTGASGEVIIMNPPPLAVMLVTLLMAGITVGVWRWFRKDRVQQALSRLNKAEKSELLHYLARETAAKTTDTSERLTLNDEGEFVETLPVTQKRKNSESG